MFVVLGLQLVVVLSQDFCFFLSIVRFDCVVIMVVVFEDLGVVVVVVIVMLVEYVVVYVLVLELIFGFMKSLCIVQDFSSLWICMGDVLLVELVDFELLLFLWLVLEGLWVVGFERFLLVQFKVILLGCCGFDLIV